MKIQIIKGEFNSHDAIDLVTQMVQVKIKYHERKILRNENEEDLKLRESKIKMLQKELFDFRKNINSEANSIQLEGIIKIE